MSKKNNKGNVNINGFSVVPTTDYVYVYLDKNQELVISSTDLHPKKSDLYDRKSDFGKCELQKEDVQEWYEKCKYIRTVRFEEMVKPITCAYWFAGCENLTEIKNMKNLDTSECVNMRDMFSCCSKLTTLDVSNFDVSNVKEMLYMFFNCNSLKFLDVSNWNTENVQDMFYMFQNCKFLHTDCSSWNVQNVKGQKIFANSPNISEPIWND